MRKLVCRKKVIGVGIGAFVFVVMCLTLVQNVAIRSKQQESVVNGKSEEQNDVHERKLVNPEKRSVRQTNPRSAIFVHVPGDVNVANSVKESINGKIIEKMEGKDKHPINDQNIEELPGLQGNDLVRLGEEGEENLDGREMPIDGQKLPGMAENLGVGEEEGAGEAILKVDPFADKPLPIVKASNKIDAIVEARPNADRVRDRLHLDDLQPPDHLDAVHMEQDGHLNRDYKKEIFLGNHEELDDMDDEEMEKKLREIFILVDHNGNNFITVDELEDWIIQKVQEHFMEASEENKHVFQSVDTDKDGLLTWREFHIQFLLALGMDLDTAEERVGQSELNEDDDTAKALQDDHEMPLESEDSERLIRYRYKWMEADKDPHDNKLNLQEFQSFRHPEQSQAMLANMVEDIVENLDKDDDGLVSEVEFVMLSVDGALLPDLTGAEKQWMVERRKEFRTVIDTDHDGKLTKEELLKYVDPQNPNHAKLEARNLLGLGDTNRDERLSLEEVLDNMDLFIGSKMVDTGRSFHDEF